MTKKFDPTPTAEDLNEIASQVATGFTSGILDNEDGYRISWSIEINKFEY